MEKKKDKGMVYSTQNSRKLARKKSKRSTIFMERKNSRKNKTSFPSDSEPEEDNSERENRELEEGPPTLTESEWSEDEDDNTETSGNKEVDSFDENSEDIEIECNRCTLKVEIPPELEESDQVLINRETGEILIFPQDESKNEESWIQRSVIGSLSQKPNDNKVFYTKGDSQKLENFLRQEREGTAKIIKERCLEHSKKCETYAI